MFSSGNGYLFNDMVAHDYYSDEEEEGDSEEEEVGEHDQLFSGLRL